MYRQIYKIIKRTFDIFISIIGIILMLFIALFIKIIFVINKNFNSIFYCHERIGKNGKRINIYKFKTMVEDSDDTKKYFNRKQIIEFNKTYKLKNDPRITKLGKFLRKLSIDELPQFVNILKGDMSIIGPRPVVGEELKKYKNQINKLLSVRPGLTGYWACNSNDCKNYNHRIKLELYYVDNMSFILDLKIIFKTIFIILKGRKVQ